MNNTTYDEFISQKKKELQAVGFDIKPDEVNPMLYEFQKEILKRAVKVGRYAIFADCGLGKTPTQLNWAQVVSQRTSKPVLILAPLAVSAQTVNEGIKFNIPVTRVGDDSDIKESGIYISNYERLDMFDCRKFSGIVIDESSILKNYAGKTRNNIIESFADTPYKLACTATPSPNDYMEFGNHSEFLNVMDRNTMLALFFVHDGSDTSKWRLKRHAEKDFFEWMAQWAMMVSKPSDLGFPDDGFILPPINMIEHKVNTKNRNNGKLFNDVAISATNFNQELRLTMTERLDLAAKIANSDDENYIIWIKHNAEGQILKKLIPGSIEVKGSDTPEYKEEHLIGFGQNKFRVLITKAKIAQFGMNYQNCHNQIFASLDFSFESLYQAIRRSYRFMQTEPVNINIITTDTMQNVINNIQQKQANFTKLQKHMRVNMDQEIKPVEEKTEIETESHSGKHFKIYKGDCIQTVKEIADESVDFSIFSPPFADLYTYSDNQEDLGNSKDYNEFYNHFSYLLPELGRITKPGRLVAIHCMDLPIVKQREGYIGVRDFSGIIIRAMIEAGFIFHCRVTIWKDPVTAMQRTKALGLLHKQLRKDSSMSRAGIPDYLVMFRKHGENKEPIKNAKIPVSIWQKYASPVWMDIKQGNTLQRLSARADKDEKHICPLQLGVIERAVTLWSNPGDTVFSPFMGIGSEGWQSLKMGRRFIGIELKDSYFQQALKNLKGMETEQDQGYIFEGMEHEKTYKEKGKDE